MIILIEKRLNAPIKKLSHAFIQQNLNMFVSIITKIII